MNRIDYLHHLGDYLAWIDTFLRLTGAAVLGGIIGLDREMKSHPAGLRTHMLTSLAAAAFTVLAFDVFDMAQRMHDRPSVDPIRVVQAVTAGVAFLAAGTIIRSRGEVSGLTTGAGMWTAGAIGVASGAAQFRLAVTTTVIALTILAALKWVERRAFHETERARPEAAGKEDAAGSEIADQRNPAHPRDDT